MSAQQLPFNILQLLVALQSTSCRAGCFTSREMPAAAA
jgi:hypothetical protein